MGIHKSLNSVNNRHQRNQNPKRVLIIDDDALSRGILRMFFESEGYLCEEADNGSVGLTHIETGNVDLVITDNQMPCLSGLDFLDRLQEQYDSHAPPVIMVTGNANDRVKERAYRAGATAVMEKPYDLEKLRSIACLTLTSDSHLNSRSSQYLIH